MPKDGDDGFFPTSGNDLVGSGILSRNAKSEIPVEIHCDSSSDIIIM